MEETRHAYEYHKVHLLCLGEVKKAGMVVDRGGWALNVDEAWELLIEMERNPEAPLNLQLMHEAAKKHGIEHILSRLTLNSHPVLMITEGPTTLALMGKRLTQA